MKILRVTSDLYPSVVGGLGIHTHEMSRIQVQKGHEVTVLTYDSNSSLILKEQNVYEIIKIPAHLKIFGNTFSVSFPIELLKIYKQFDIIHAHSHLFFNTVICALLRRIGSVPLVITNHGFVSQTAPMWIQKIYLPTIAKWTFQSADKIICYTEIEKRQLIDLGISSDNIDIIHNGVDAKIFIQSKIIPDKQILWIGRFNPGKGVEYLIDAFKIFLVTHPDFLLLMVGTGPSKEAILQKIHYLHLEKSIIIKENIPNTDVPELYQRSHLFVLPSLEEGVPRTILEAMSCSTPVVCTQLPQLFKIVSNAGILVPAKNPIALADAMSLIVENAKIAYMFGQEGRKKIEKDYSWEDTVEQTLSLYEEVLYQQSV
jgi:glycosyltransferase involved in cell wall biosynthesis